jgi:hypothetical protein
MNVVVDVTISARIVKERYFASELYSGSFSVANIFSRVVGPVRRALRLPAGASPSLPRPLEERPSPPLFDILGALR